MAQFSTSPSTQITAEGRTALFSCRHPNADIISWNINGTSSLSFSTPDIVSSSNTQTLLHVLSIVGRSMYNQSRVECIATFFDGQPTQTSAAVKLIVQGVLQNINSHCDIF